MRGLVLVAWVVSLTAAGVASADEAARKKLAKKHKSLTRSLGSSHRSVAGWAKRRGLIRISTRHYMEAIALDPEDARARRAVGYVSRKKVWTLKGGRLPKLDKVKGAARDQLKGELDKNLAVHRRKGVTAYSKLAAEAKKLGLEAERLQFLQRVLAFDTGHAAARKTLGWEKNGDVWIRTDLQAMVKAAKVGSVDTVLSGYEKTLGLELNRRGNKRLWIAASWPDDQLADLIRYADAAMSAFMGWYGLTKLTSDPFRMMFFDTELAYKQAIDKLDDGDAARKKWLQGLYFAFISGNPICANRFPVDQDTTAYRRDRVVYLVGNELTHRLSGGAPPWLSEGMSWNLTLKILGTKNHWGVSLSRSSSALGEKDWNDHSLWRSYLRELVLLNEAPRSANLLVTKNYNQIEDALAAFAWSMTDWLIGAAPKKLAAFCRELAAEKSPAEALKAAFGWTFAELDAAWKKHVISTY